MKAKDEVRRSHPQATARAYTNLQRGVTHWLIWRDGIERGPRLSEGKTEALAWREAFEREQQQRRERQGGDK